MFYVKKYINRIKKSKDGRTLVANFGYLSLLQIAGYIFPLITMPYLARVIGVDGFGKIAFASAVVVWFQTVADWGFNYTATRDVAKNRDDKDKVSEIFSNVLWARCFLMIVSFLLLLLAILIVPIFRENYAVILVTFLLVPGHIMFPDWFFQAMERMKYITILNLLSKLLFTIAVFVFIKNKGDYILQPLFTTLGYIVSGIISMYFILDKWKIKIKSPVFSSIISTIKGSTDVFINNIMPNLYNSFSIMLLGFFGGPVSNGLLDAEITLDGKKLIVQETPFEILSQVKLANEEPLPTVEDYLDAFVNCKNTKLIIEFKTHNSKEREDELVEKVIKMVNDRGIQDKVEYISFGINIVQQVKKLAPEADVYYLNGDLTPQILSKMGMTGMDYHFNVFTKRPEWVKEAHELGLKVNTWTVNQPEDIKKMIDLKVDFITTDEPLLVNEIINKQ
jgi:hypothetical protein